MIDKETINRRLEKMKEAVAEAQGFDKHSKITYCTKCDDYIVGRYGYLDCDFMNENSEKDHFTYHVISDYEETSFDGYKRALEWVTEINNDR